MQLGKGLLLNMECSVFLKLPVLLLSLGWSANISCFIWLIFHSYIAHTPLRSACAGSWFLQLYISAMRSETCFMCGIAILLICSHTSSAKTERSQTRAGKSGEAETVSLFQRSPAVRQMATMPTVDKTSEDYMYSQSILKTFQDISRKLVVGVPLSTVEEEFWASWSRVIWAMLNDPSTKLCHRFKSEIPPKPAACCTVPFDPSGIKFALCFWEEFILSPESQMTETVTRTVMMEETERVFYNESTTFINLLTVECDPPFDDGLCSQYVSFTCVDCHLFSSPSRWLFSCVSIVR